MPASDATSGVRRVGLALVVGAAVVGGSGCFAVPYVLPPVRVSVGGGMAFGAIHAQQRPGGGAGTVTTSGTVTAAAPVPVVAREAGLVSVRGTLQPQAAMPSESTRWFDLGVGYGLDHLTFRGLPDVDYHGPFAELAVHPVHPAAGNNGARVSVALSAEYLMNGAGQAAGFGTTVAARLEIFQFAQGGFSGTSGSDAGAFAIGGYGQGEAGVGVELAGSAREMYDEWYWTVTASVTVRLPASLGGVAGIVNPLIFLGALGGRNGRGVSSGNSSGGFRSSSSSSSSSGSSGSSGGGSGGGSGPRSGVPTGGR